MSNRVAFFSDAEDLIETFNLDASGEVIFDAHYNISRGHHIPVITEKNDVLTVGRLRWGKEFEKEGSIPEKADKKILEEMDRAAVRRAIIPISGFYIWKDEAKKDHPFFVRKIDNTLLYVAAFTFRSDKDEYTYSEMIMTEANTLIAPISDSMPLLLKERFAKDWLKDNITPDKILKQAGSQFLITELTVHRVTKEVKDPSKNEKSLIQPIPK